MRNVNTERKLLKIPVIQKTFSTDIYTGNDSVRNIINNIDLVNNKGLVVIKGRSVAYDHLAFDTVRGKNSRISLQSSSSAITSDTRINDFLTNGFSLSGQASVNDSPQTFVAHTFRAAPKFLDIIGYTGASGGATQQIPHLLGIKPGIIIIKWYTGSTNWAVYNRISGATYVMFLNSNSGVALASSYFPNEPDENYFTVGSNNAVNQDGQSYIAYLFAHDTSSTGTIQCVSSTSSGGANRVDLPWMAQYILSKRLDGSSDWFINDSVRGFGSSTTPTLYANLTDAEDNSAYRIQSIDQTGFIFNPVSSGNYIHLAIRA